jgi:hypothetical protein
MALQPSFLSAEVTAQGHLEPPKATKPADLQ